MICHRCLQRLARRDVVTSTSNAIVHLRPRPFSHSASPRSPPVAVETTSASSSTSNTTSPPETITSNKRTAPAVVSSVPEGTPLKGLSFLKTQPDPLARADHEYPEWLWRVLDEQRASGKPDGAEIEGDLFAKSKKQRRRAAKALRKQALRNPEALAPKVPLYEQSVDLPAGDGTTQGAQQATDARLALTKAMRNQRRSKIKEDNFLRQMR